MYNLRTRHNTIKAHLIKTFVKRGSTVLDVGCGRGGDIHKFNKVGALVTALEPNCELLCEAAKRLKKAAYPNIRLMHGDIRNAPSHQWDVVCYMFSIHWTLADNPTRQLAEAMARVKPGGHLIGTVPNGDAILRTKKWSSPEGNFVVNGNKVKFNVVGPFYSGEVQEEPILTSSALQELVGNCGGTLVSWEPLGRDNLSQFYCKFIITKGFF